MYPFIRPTMPGPESWAELLAAAYSERHFTNGGPLVLRLERELERRYCRPDRRVVVTSSGTAGLVAALMALDVHGEVAMPSFTFAATAHAVRLAGCVPLFVDVSPEEWELDRDQLERVLQRRRVGAIVHVRSLGLCRSLDELEQLAKSHEVPLIVDAAACLAGREPGGEWAGGRGDAEVFSMHATKAFGIGEGGVVFAPVQLEHRVRRAINFGLDEGIPDAPGFNGKLSEVQAAVALAVLERIEGFVARRAEVASAYRERLPADWGFDHAHHPGRPPWQAYPVAIAGDVEAAARRLGALGVEARRYYSPALHRTPAFEQAVVLPVTDELASRMLCLPVYSDMTERELEQILGAVCDALLAPGASPT